MFQQRIFITKIAIPISAEDSFQTRIVFKKKNLRYYSIISNSLLLTELDFSTDIESIYGLNSILNHKNPYLVH